MINIKVNELQQATSNDIKHLVVENGNLKITDPPKSGGGMKIVNHGTSDTTFALKPNEKHIWGEVANLELTLEPPTDNSVVNQYVFEFTSGNPKTNLILPADLKFADGFKFPILPLQVYEGNIVNNHITIMNYNL